MMKYPITNDERAKGIVEVVLIPEQAEAVAEFLEIRGMTLSPPADLGSNCPTCRDNVIRICTFLEPPTPEDTMDPENTQADVEAEARHDRYDHIQPGTLANRLGYDPYDDDRGPTNADRED